MLFFFFKILSFSRTIEKRLGRAFTAQGGLRRWTPHLQNITTAINNSINSSIDMKPSDVNRSNAPALFDYTEQKKAIYERKYGTKFKLGDIVRIPINPKRDKLEHRKDYMPKWSKELYQIVQIYHGDRVLTFRLVDSQGGPLDRRYYNNELNLVLPLSDMQ